ncbi:NAD(P)/FAD-dependent oxidoreductase [Kibdelosporangium philippinense]|uniref:NAD(P)/FAD-dependent oxidoreductase n=1 Tax=Kibdelosporangium philippinense TaxID=211113 RepID=A0ABS8Z8T5_9PSEU|nr:NAD(P)/FAD-dependent oxidoreductase [Kibdelosporangium philippinense]MCE7003433.1 NAD(P)/FAD-dependent oxidoreductase [Kibdelosporangium philippinense]
MSNFDVVFVGAGHNALVAAAYLAKAGRSVCLLEQADVPGGFVRSEELTLPGFVHDTFSALHPFFAGGPVFAELGPDLSRHGLRYVQGGVSTGSSLSDGRTAVIATDPAVLNEELDRLGEYAAWHALLGDVSGHIEAVLPLMGADLTPAAPVLERLQNDTTPALPFSTLFTGNGYDLITERFTSEELRMALLPWLLHMSISPYDAGGALWAAFLAAVLPQGNPQPVGGSGKLASALTALVREHGGVIRTGVSVDAVLTKDGRAVGVRTLDGEVVTGSVVAASTTPDQLYGHLLREADGVNIAVRQQAKRYGYRRGCFQINLALSERPQFLDSRLDEGGGINLGRSVAHLLDSVHQADTGYLAAHPSISWHEATAVDATRAPAGQAVVRLQVLETPLAPIGDAAGEITTSGQWTSSVAEHYADRIIAEAGRHFKGLEELIVGRHVLSPADLARLNPSCGPGDHTAGHGALSQNFMQRPIPAHRGGYATAVPGLYQIGASTWPGAGVSGSSGRAFAQNLLA